MPQVLPIPLAAQIGEGRSRAFTTEGLVNLYPETAQGPSNGPWSLASFPGHLPYATLGGGATKVRGQWSSEDRGHFVVAGTTLYRMTGAAGAAIGTIEGSQLCDIRETSSSLAIVADTRAYLYSYQAGTLAEITDPDLPLPSSCTFRNQRLVFTKRNSGQFVWTEVNQDGNIDALSFATAESETDTLIAARHLGDTLCLFGTESTEFWAGTGTPGATAFRRSTAQAPLQIGCLSRDSICSAADTLVFLARGKPGGVFVSTLNERISDYAVDAELEKITDFSKARAITFMYGGHLFYELTIPGQFSAAYDFSTRRWVQTVRGLYPYGQRPGGDSGRTTLAVVGNRLVTALDDGNLYEISRAANDNAGVELIREISTPPWLDDGRTRTVGRVELEIETGVGLISGDDARPVAMMSVSKDDGRTWQPPRNAEFGGQGQYGKKVFWTRFGKSDRWRFKFRVSARVPVTIFSARAHFEDHGF